MLRASTSFEVGSSFVGNLRDVDNTIRNLKRNERLVEQAKAVVIPMNAAVLREAERIRREHQLDRPDAVMVAAIFTDATNGSALLLSRDSKAFDDPGIREELARRVVMGSPG